MRHFSRWKSPPPGRGRKRGLPAGHDTEQRTLPLYTDGGRAALSARPAAIPPHSGISQSASFPFRATYESYVVGGASCAEGNAPSRTPARIPASLARALFEATFVFLMRQHPVVRRSSSPSPSATAPTNKPHDGRISDNQASTRPVSPPAYHAAVLQADASACDSHFAHIAQHSSVHDISKR